MKGKRQAALKGSDGKVYVTGAIHDIDVLPKGISVAEEGYVDEAGEFVNREAAKKLDKTTPPPDFPGLGVEHRQETGIMTPEQIDLRRKLALGRDAPPAGSRVIGSTSPRESEQHFSFVGPVKSQLGGRMHEDLHLMFNRIAKKYGRGAATKLARNIFSALPPDQQQHLHEYSQHATNGAIDNRPSMWHEENLAHMLIYLNSPNVRAVFHRKRGELDPATGQLTPEGRRFQDTMKGAYRSLQQISPRVDESWIKHHLTKSETQFFHDLQKWELTDEDVDAVSNMLNTHYLDTPEFKAAKFMTNGYVPSDADLHSAIVAHEGSPEKMALHAHNLPVTDENIKILLSIILAEEMNKSEIEVAARPRHIKPYNSSAKELAEVIQDASSHKELKPVELKGKHSKGTALVKEKDSDKIWLLKPGSGRLSSAEGVREEKASHSQREVAFDKAAVLLGLGAYVPDAELLLIDGQQVAALEFFAGTYLPAERAKKVLDTDLMQLFNRFVSNGLLYKWAAMDYILGQTDRHSGNLLIDTGYNIKFIDAGSAFAGPSFNPALDPNSFVPYYLRVFASRKWNELTTKERFDALPTLSQEVDGYIKHWVDGIDEAKLISLLHEYGVRPDYVIDRLRKFKAWTGPKNEFLRRFYTNLL